MTATASGLPASRSRRLSPATRRVGWVAIVVAALALLVVASIDRGGAETDAERIQRLTESFACPRCNGEGQIVTTPCTTCRGDGRVREERKLTVSVPAGIDSGQRIALEGQGEAGPRGGPAGDLYVAVTVKEHPELVRRGTELYHELPVSFPQAALGATLTVPTVEGTEEVQIPAGTQSGTEVRLRGRGVPRLRGVGRGDLHVIVTVVVPHKPTKKERELLKQLDEVSGPAVLPKGGPSLVDRLRDLFG